MAQAREATPPLELTDAQRATLPSDPRQTIFPPTIAEPSLTRAAVDALLRVKRGEPSRPSNEPSAVNPREDTAVLLGASSGDALGEGGLGAASRVTLGRGVAVHVGHTLGEGGMGVVRAGTQRALGRGVAVKTLRSDARSDEATLKLLREAWITGALEHPNIVPVYDLSVDEDGAPVLVLKRIEGDAWSGLVADAARVRERFGAEDLLEWNLRVLLQVCNAAHYAHRHGIVHRDIKPENVMLGRYGEVYLLDWGIAVALDDDGSGRLPLARDALALAGTPAYMAPEMLGGTAPTVQTDVYLLGATLFECVAGAPPHRGRSVLALLAKIAQETPALPDDAPDELRAVCARALARDPAERFASAEELRLALERFLQHRGAARLEGAARAGLGALREAVRRALENYVPRTGERALPTRTSPDGDELDADAAAHATVYRLLGECRFGFRQALAAWEGDAAARAGLRDAVACVAEYELTRRDAGAAAALVAELGDGSPAGLRERLAALRRERLEERRKRAALEALRQQHDPAIGQRTRVFIALIMCGVWLVAPAVSVLFGGRSTPTRMALSSLVSLTVITGLLVWARESMTRTALNRGVAGTVVLVMAQQLVLSLGALVRGVEWHVLLPALAVVWAGAAGSIGVYVDPRMGWAALGYAVTSALALFWPERWHLWVLIGNGSVLAVTWRIWGREEWRRWRRERAQRAARRER